jgi:hypothetical protein
MASTSREIVLQTLNFEGPPRAPQQLWHLPWAELHYPEELKAITEAFPPDIIGAPGFHSELPPTEGEATAVGRFVDPWGAVFENIQEGVIGEVKEPIVQDWERDAGKVHVPRELLSIDPDQINAFCGTKDQFVQAGACPRPFEQLQFLRGTANLYMDLIEQPKAMQDFVKVMHDFYCELLEAWAQTDVDGLMMMDDWGSQQDLLINPELWVDIFKPMYKDYIDIAHGAGKKMFMHSDGHTLSIYPHLVELGLDAFNSQIWCMGIDNLRPFAGKITFWGEMDRQHKLPEATPGQIDAAVREWHAKLWKDGGCIAQCEFGAGAKPENVRQVFATWQEVTQGG